MRAVLTRLGLVVCGLFLGIALLEGVLQAAAAWNGWSLRPTGTGRADAARRILAVGDSNTFGLYLRREEAYPAQLAKRLPDASVTNAGDPGMNSSRVRAILPSLLAETKPTDVLILVGVNDIWTVPEGDPLVRRPWWVHLRTARVVYQVWWWFHVPPSDVAHIAEDHSPMLVGDAVFDVGWRVTSTLDPALVAHTLDNLRSMVAAVREVGARPWFLTYASGTPIYALASNPLRSVATEVGVPLIDLGAAMLARCGRCEDVFFGDGHPNAAGYAIVADVVAKALARPE